MAVSNAEHHLSTDGARKGGELGLSPVIFLLQGPWAVCRKRHGLASNGAVSLASYLPLERSGDSGSAAAPRAASSAHASSRHLVHQLKSSAVVLTPGYLLDIGYTAPFRNRTLRVGMHGMVWRTGQSYISDGGTRRLRRLHGRSRRICPEVCGINRCRSSE